MYVDGYFFCSFFFFDDEGQCSSSKCWPLSADDGFNSAASLHLLEAQVGGFINLQITESQKPPKLEQAGSKRRA